ncbi:MAG: hypothetical protein KDK39_09420, partial [Leptospiraceae bacterium]|nr:hypothetical protein [Leptospiraceae bacterium]
FYQVKERNLYQHVKVKLIGRFGRTIYPAIIRLQSMRMNQSIESEMTLTFNSINLTAQCPLSAFPTHSASQ